MNKINQYIEDAKFRKFPKIALFQFDFQMMGYAVTPIPTNDENVETLGFCTLNPGVTINISQEITNRDDVIRIEFRMTEIGKFPTDLTFKTVNETFLITNFLMFKLLNLIKDSGKIWKVSWSFFNAPFHDTTAGNALEQLNQFYKSLIEIPESPK